MPDDKRPIDALLELGLFAPLGLALEARDRLPGLIARGRQQVDSQVTLARMMGKYAVKEGEKDLRRRVGDVTETLSGLGLIPPPNPAAPAAPTPAPASSNGSTNGRANAPAGGEGSPPTEAEEPVIRSRAELAIPGYDTLSASQVVQRLAGLAPEELEAVGDYESGTRGRRTILSKVAQLQSGTSAQ